MADTFQDILREVIKGFRDAVLGSANIFKMDQVAADGNEKKGTEQLTVLAQRRAARSKQTPKEEKKDGLLFLQFKDQHIFLKS